MLPLTAKENRRVLSELTVLLLILLPPVFTFIIIISHPEARDIHPSDAPGLSLNGQHSFSWQSRENLKFANSTSLVNGIKDYYKAWPPVFPATLYVFNKAGIPPLFVNLVIYLFNMAWFYYYLKKCTLSTTTRNLVLFSYAIGAFHYYNLAIQVVSEGLFILTAQLIFTLTLHYSREDSTRTVVWLAFFTSILILIKYLGLFWIFPVVSICLLVFAKDMQTGLKKVAVYGILTVLTTIPWFVWIYKTTGHITGWDRSAERLISHLTDFKHNLFFSLKTYYIDFFSTEWASHSIITGFYEPQVWDLIVLLFLSIVAILLCKIIRDYIHHISYLNLKNIRGFLRDENLFFLLLLFSTSNFGVILFLWTTGNNDPIYTRFLYPSYPFIVLSVIKVYDLFIKKTYRTYCAVLFNMLFVIILGSQAYKTFVLCNRYFNFR